MLSRSALTQDTATSKTHEVHSDGSITFRFKDLGARKMQLRLEGQPLPLDMQKSGAEDWSITTPAVPPGIYGYSFDVDGQPRLDPKNPVITPNLVSRSNLVTVPGSSPQLWEATDVPHGILHHYFYTSKVVSGLDRGQSDYFVYTPAGYDPKASRPYPVLYLLHGFSDTPAAWTAVGQAHFILDNLIAQGKVKPMVVVMPLGYGDMNFVSRGFSVWNDDASIDRNVSLFSKALLTEILPQVEANYSVSKDRKNRAIAGLSMGGLESLIISLRDTDQFAWIGGFSSAVQKLHYQELFSDLDPKKAALRLLWIACGRDDDLITSNRKLVAWLRTKNMPVSAIETPGMHTWMVWRDNLIHFAPLLFQNQ
jgi:enterochelin esterase family protein